jgi:hypothetical protein
MKISRAAVVSIACIPVAGAFVVTHHDRSCTRASSINTIQLNLCQHPGDEDNHNINNNDNQNGINHWFGPFAAAITGLTIASQVAMAGDVTTATTSFPDTTSMIVQQLQGTIN